MATCGGSRSRARGEPGLAGPSTFGLWSSSNRLLGGPELLVQVREEVPHSIPKVNNAEMAKVETLSGVHKTRTTTTTTPVTMTTSTTMSMTLMLNPK